MSFEDGGRDGRFGEKLRPLEIANLNWISRSPRSASPHGGRPNPISDGVESTNYQTFQIAPSSLIATSGTADEGRRQPEPGW